jgi:TRAP-type transport system small permease protein
MVSKIWYKIQSFFGIISVASLFSICILLILQVVLRNFFSLGMAWIEETARFLFISSVFLIVPHLCKENSHIQIDIIPGMLKSWRKKIIHIFIYICCTFFAFMFLLSYADFMKKTWNVMSPAMSIPNFLFFPFCFIGMFSYLVENIIKIVLEIKGEQKETCQ